MSVYTFKKFYISYRHIYIYIHRYILTIPLKMTEVWSKRPVLPLISTVKIFTKSLLI